MYGVDSRTRSDRHSFFMKTRKKERSKPGKAERNKKGMGAILRLFLWGRKFKLGPYNKEQLYTSV